MCIRDRPAPEADAFAAAFDALPGRVPGRKRPRGAGGLGRWQRTVAGSRVMVLAKRLRARERAIEASGNSGLVKAWNRKFGLR
eukprot:15429527-Alexandrium_andersonii.AAC.1